MKDLFTLIIIVDIRLRERLKREMIIRKNMKYLKPGSTWISDCFKIIIKNMKLKL